MLATFTCTSPWLSQIKHIECPHKGRCWPWKLFFNLHGSCMREVHHRTADGEKANGPMVRVVRGLLCVYGIKRVLCTRPWEFFPHLGTGSKLNPWAPGKAITPHESEPTVLHFAHTHTETHIKHSRQQARNVRETHLTHVVHRVKIRKTNLNYLYEIYEAGTRRLEQLGSRLWFTVKQGKSTGIIRHST
mmetsp:Transcript_10459/g.19576  ORF Transcript_10459/g.19576 Transcript_10459/m.19576 type:complete len:189 (-) Transcript_10459:2118-2684(-)